MLSTFIRLNSIMSTCPILVVYVVYPSRIQDKKYPGKKRREILIRIRAYRLSIIAGYVSNMDTDTANPYRVYVL